MDKADISGIVSEIVSEIDETGYPSDFLADYEPMECLSHSEINETFLVKGKKDGILRIAKSYSKKSYPAANAESDILSGLRHEGLPHLVACYENDDSVFVVREYAPGVPLDEIVGDGMPVKDALNIAKQLCGILAYLHGKQPAIIHRDIKPGNIIFNEGKIKLIDFGISRKYNEKATTDTTYIGTREYSPPEQFGYSQTDNRSDIYAFGVLLYYMLTGETDLRQIERRIRDRRLMRVIMKCTAFSPDRRYASILSVKKALDNLEGVRRYKTGLIASAALVVLLLTGIFLYNRHRGPDPVYEDFIAQDRIELSLDSQRMPVKRAEICRIVVEALGIYDEYAESNFSDVPSDSPFYRDISSAMQAKLVQGYADGSFRPDEPVSAGMYSVLIMERALGIYKVSDWSNMDRLLVAAAKAGNNYGIITDEQLAKAVEDPYSPMETIPEGILMPKAISGAWVEWKSSDESVAAVDSGQVIPVRPGKAVITARYRRGGEIVVDTCEVIIY